MPTPSQPRPTSLRSAVPSADGRPALPRDLRLRPGREHHLHAARGWRRLGAPLRVRRRQQPALGGPACPATRPAGPFSATYAHDARGNVTAMPHLASLAWDAKDRLTTVDLGGGGTVHYTYDSAGRRVRKVIQRVGSIVEETVYVAGWERLQAAERRRPRRGAGDAPRVGRRPAHRDRRDRHARRRRADRRPHAA